MNTEKSFYKSNNTLYRLYKILSTKILNMGFKTKLFIIFLFISIIPILSSTLYIGRTLVKELRTLTLQNSMSAIDQINSNIEGKLEAYYQITTAKYMDTTLKGYLVNHYIKDTDYYDAYKYIDENMRTILTMNIDINSAAIYIPNTTLPSDAQYIKHITKDIITEVWFNKISSSSGNIIISDTYKDEDGTYVFSLARYLNYYSFNYPYGIFTLNIKESSLYSLLKDQDKDNYLFITNMDGKIISCKDKSSISKDFYKLIDKDIKTSIEKNKSGYIDTYFNNKRSMLIYSSLNNNWKTFFIVPYENFLSVTFKKFNNIIIVYIISIISCILLIYITSYMITKRISHLTKEIAKIKRQNFNVNLDHLGNDEIGQMAAMFKSMAGEINRLIEEGYKKEILKNQAELNLLQSQINPHFLYNTLSSISALSLKENAPNVNRMVNLLSKFYRVSLHKGKNVITFEEEISLTKCYVEIQQTRFQNMLHVIYNIDENILKYNTIKLLLQPFIENSINHGLWNIESGISIILSLKEIGDHISIKIIDDGMGINKEKLKIIQALKEESYEGYGLKNIDTRIKLFFGNEYGINIFSRLGIGTTIEIVIPIKFH